jgi:hypothetical protein
MGLKKRKRKKLTGAKLHAAVKKILKASLKDPRTPANSKELARQVLRQKKYK